MKSQYRVVVFAVGALCLCLSGCNTFQVRGSSQEKVASAEFVLMAKESFSCHFGPALNFNIAKGTKFVPNDISQTPYQTGNIAVGTDGLFPEDTLLLHWSDGTQGGLVVNPDGVFLSGNGTMATFNRGAWLLLSGECTNKSIPFERVK